jgi:hypothetical protein
LVAQFTVQTLILLQFGPEKIKTFIQFSKLMGIEDPALCSAPHAGDISHLQQLKPPNYLDDPLSRYSPLVHWAAVPIVSGYIYIYITYNHNDT